MSNINKQALREAAEKATPGNWWIDSHGQAMVSFIDDDVLEVFATDNKRAAVRHEDTGNLSRWRNDNDATFIATANPAAVLAILDELEAAEALNKHLELAIRKAEGCSEALRRKTEAAEKRIAELEAVREVFLRAKALMYQSGGAPIENSLNPIDAWLYDAERAAADIGVKGE